MTESGQLRLPSCCGAVPSKSNAISSPAMVTAARSDEIALGAFEHVARLEAAVGQARERRPHDPLRVGVQLVHRRDDPVAPSPLAELADAPLGEAVRGELGAEVAAALVGVPHLRDERVEDAVVEPGRRDHDALVRERARAGGHAPGLRAADVGVVGASDREADRGARDERHVGEVRPAGVGVVEDEDVVGRGSCSMTAATASGIAPRWTGMCSACAIMRPRSSKSAVEQSRRSLMLAENAERISTAPISSATERSALPRTWSSIFTLSSRSRHLSSAATLSPSLAPTHPRGSQQVEPSSSSTAGPVTS